MSSCPVSKSVVVESHNAHDNKLKLKHFRVFLNFKRIIIKKITQTLNHKINCILYKK